MFKSAEISQLQTRIAELEASLSTATGGTAALETQLAELKTTLATAQSQVTAHAATITGLNTQLTTAQSAQAAAEARAVAAEASIDSQVTARLAAAGVDPIARAPKTGDDNNGQTMSRVEFAKLSPHARAEFIRSKGKLID